MPSDPAEAKALERLDPFELRARGLDEPLPPTHLGRALFHLNQRRGFQSNRKTDRGDNENGLIRDATARLDQAMLIAGARTYGEFLHRKRAAAPTPRETPAVRTRLTLKAWDGDKTEAGYDFYPDRRHLSEEFGKLWQAQAAHQPGLLTGALRDALFEIVFHQRPLKEPEVGRCLFTDEPRLPRTHPLVQRRVLYETVNALKIAAPGAPARPLTDKQRDSLIHELDNQKPTKASAAGRSKVSFKKLAKRLKLSAEEGFTLETAVRDAIACDPVRSSLSHPDRFGARWGTLDSDTQWQIIRRIRDVTSDVDHAGLVNWLVAEHGLDRDKAEAVASAPLLEGYSRLGETATHRILASLQAGVVTYDRAVAQCGWHHSNTRTGEVLDELPYYGQILDRHVIPGSQDPAHDDVTRYGRITNPTVHIGLNQLRRLVNRIIAVHGKPDEIVVELARELKQSEEQKREASKRLRETTEAAIRRGEKLREMGVPDTGANRIRLRLWESLGTDVMSRNCPYTGQRISAAMLFDGTCDVDHTLPYSRTLDDGFSNRTLCLKEANRQKGNKTPWEAWGGTASWPAIEENLKNLPPERRWRFAPDAMERFEGERGFLDRALVDTQYLARIARSYLDALFTEGGHVWVVPGRMTEMLRRHWGLNALLPDRDRGAVKAKNRMDHRHHAIDAAVIAATDRALVSRISRASGRDEAVGAEDVARSIDPPWEGFRDDIGAQLGRIVVSHRADHGSTGTGGTTGRLHNDTAYGLTGETRNGVPLVVTRKPLESLQPAQIGKIRDEELRQRLAEATQGREGKEFAAALVAFARQEGPYRNIRRVRLQDAIDVIEIQDAGGRAYKGYKPDSNHLYEVWRMPDGAFVHHVVTTFCANSGRESRPHPAAKRLYRLFKNDMVRLERSKFGSVIVTVEKFDGNGTITLVAHNEANADQRYRKTKEDLFIRLRPRGLVEAGARRLVVDEIGRFRDPGPPACSRGIA